MSGNTGEDSRERRAVGRAGTAFVFAVSGSLKSTQSKQRMIETGQTGVRDVPLPAVRVVAACELLGVLGLILPQATGIAPLLTPLAALGLGVVMIGAGIAHTRLREPRNVAANALILLVCLRSARAARPAGGVKAGDPSKMLDLAGDQRCLPSDSNSRDAEVWVGQPLAMSSSASLKSGASWKAPTSAKKPSCAAGSDGSRSSSGTRAATGVPFLSITNRRCWYRTSPRTS